MERLSWPFDPMRPSQLGRTLTFRPRRPGERLHYHADGWRASTRTPPQPHKTLSHFERIFAERTVRADEIRRLLDKTRAWTAKGIGVYACRPPTTAEMVALEDRLSGFDQAEFVRQFRAAGGVWLDVDQAGYASYDGSHLTAEAATRLSRDLAEMIRRTESRPPRPAGP